MADYLQILRGITGGLQAGQDFRERRQLERAREQQLESGEYDLQARRATRRVRDPESTRVLGALDPSSVQDYQQTFGDPFAFKLLDFFKDRRARRKRKQAVSAQSPLLYNESLTNEAPPLDLPEIQAPEAPEYADGGAVQPEMTDEEMRAERLYIAQQEAAANGRRDAAARDKQRALDVEDKGEQIARNGGVTDEDIRQRAERRRNSGQLIRGVPELDEAVNSFVSPVLGPNFIPQPESTGRPSGPRGPRVDPQAAAARRQRAALPLGEAPAEAAAPAQASALPVAGGPRRAAPARASALPAEGATEGRVDFSQLDVDPKEVPNMTTDDWREYRAKIVDAARQSGRPEAIAQANNLVTQMQQQGFLSYGQQGLALQQAGNLKGAMAAYRAAFQYFPNGNDVEFGLIKDRQGQQQIVGFGRDEKTGKVVEGSQIVMNAEQAARLLENFTKPEAFRAWTKDWRDFEEGKRRFNAGLADKQRDDSFRERQYTEVTKPLAQAQADSLANNSEAAIVRAERGGVTGTFRPGDLQRSEAAFRERLDLVGLTDEAKKDQLASVMSQIKASNPSTPDNVIINAVVAAERDGTLAQRLKAMGIQ